jgi:hypothetical protein
LNGHPDRFMGILSRLRKSSNKQEWLPAGFGIEAQAGPMGMFDAMTFADIDWFNYHGSDDGTTIGIPTDRVKFFLRNASACSPRHGAPRRISRVLSQSCAPSLSGYDRGLVWQRGAPRWSNSKAVIFEREIILWGVRWYVAYPISYRQLEGMMEEQGVEVDHSNLNRWVLKYVPLLDQAFRARKRRVGGILAN